MTTFNETAKAFYAAFDTFTRDDGTTYVSLVDGSPEWMRDAIYSAHEALGGRLPDDWTYNACREIASAIEDVDDATEASDIDECEMCDSLVDVYNADLTRWLASHLDNVALCDEAISEGLISEDSDLIARIRSGQYIALTRICDALRTAIETEANRVDDELERAATCDGDPELCPCGREHQS